MNSRVFYGNLVHEDLKHFLLRTLQFVEGSMSFTYLGVPIFMGKLKAIHLWPLANNILDKFDRWSGKTLSLVGRV